MSYTDNWPTNQNKKEQPKPMEKAQSNHIVLQ